MGCIRNEIYIPYVNSTLKEMTFMWYEGLYKGYNYRVKAYDEPSNLGINGSRISKLYVTDRDKCVVLYFDRRWVDIPTREDGQWLTGFLEYFEEEYRVS